MTFWVLIARCHFLSTLLKDHLSIKEFDKPVTLFSAHYFIQAEQISILELPRSYSVGSAVKSNFEGSLQNRSCC